MFLPPLQVRRKTIMLLGRGYAARGSGRRLCRCAVGGVSLRRENFAAPASVVRRVPLPCSRGLKTIVDIIAEKRAGE